MPAPQSRSLDAERFYFEGEPEMNIARNESTRIMHALMRDGFERRCLAAGLRNCELAGVAVLLVPGGLS